MAYLIRPNQRTLDWLALQRETHFPGHFGSKNHTDNKNMESNDDNEGVLSIYIRHGDKASEMKLVDVMVYMNTAVDMFDRGLIIAANDKPQIPGMQPPPLPNSDASTNVSNFNRRKLKMSDEPQLRIQPHSQRGDSRLLGDPSLDNNDGNISSSNTTNSNSSNNNNNRDNNTTDTGHIDTTGNGTDRDSSSAPPSPSPTTSPPPH